MTLFRRVLAVVGRRALCHRRALTATILGITLVGLLDGFWTLLAAPESADLVSSRAAALTSGDAIRAAAATLGVVGPLFFIVLGGLVTGGPFAWRTATSEAVLDGRHLYVAARLVLVAAVVPPVLLSVVLARVVLAWSFRLSTDQAAIAPVVAVRDTLVGVGIAGLGALLWGAATILVTVVSRSRLVGVAVVTIYAFAETALGARLGSVSRFLPTSAQVDTLAGIDFLPSALTLLPGPDGVEGQVSVLSLVVTVSWLVLFSVTAVISSRWVRF